MHKSKPISKQNQKYNGEVQKKKMKRKKQPKKITNEEGDPLIKHLNDFVTSIKISHSSKPIYTGGRIIAMARNLYSCCNQQISIYNYETKSVTDKIKQMNQQIVNFCICPQQKHIVTFTQSSLVRVMHLQTKKVLHTMRMNNNFANDMQFSPDGRYIAFAFGNTVHIHTFQTMKRTHTYNPTNSKFIITKLQWHPVIEKLQIITCDLQRNIAVFDYILNKVIAVSEPGEGGTQFCLSPNGQFLVSLNNLQVKIYQTQQLKLRSKMQLQQYMETVNIVDHNVYVGGQQTQLYSFPLHNPGLSKLKKHPGCTDNGVAKIMSIGGLHGRKLLVLSTEQNITVLAIGKAVLEFEGMIIGYNDQIIDIKNSKSAITQSESQEDQECPYFAMVTNSNNIKIIEKQSHRLKYLINGHTNTVLCIDYWHPYLASGGKDNILKLWKIDDDANTIKLLANYNGHSGDILSLVALVKTKIIATVSEDNTIKLWSMCLQAQQKVQIKSAIRTVIAHQKSINAIKVSPKQDLLATCSQDKTIKIWNQHLTNVMTLAGHRRGVWDIAFHPVQQLIVSAGGDGMLKGWNLQDGECLWSMGQGAALIRCSWIYYNQIVTGSLNGIIKIWDIRKQTSLSYDKHQGKIWALDVTKKQNKAVIYSGATDSVYHIWSDNTEQMKQNIMLQHELQQQQRIFYDQHMADKKYCQGAYVAFKANYTKLFINALEKMSCKINCQQTVEFDSQGKLMLNEVQQAVHVTQQEFQQMVLKLKQTDLTRLLRNIQTMISTVKLYKIGNRLLLCLLKKTKFSQLTELNGKFSLPETVSQDNINEQYFNEKKSDLVRWLQNMISFEQKHNTRLQKYIIGTHWIQHLYKIENPFSY